MKFLLLFTVLLALTTGCQNDNDSKAPAARDTLFALNVDSNIQNPNSHIGLFEANKLDSTFKSDFEFVLRFRFDSSNLTSSLKCIPKSGGPTAVVEHTVAYKIENGKLLILEDKETEHTENGITCTITARKTIPAFATDFKVENGIAILSDFMGSNNLVIRKIGN